jgi:hypothetical protein
MMNENLFQALSQWVKARNEEDQQKIVAAHKEIRDSIMKSYKRLQKAQESLKQEIEDIKETLREPKGRSENIRKMQNKQRLLQLVENYQSSAYGNFAPERFGQEVSWAWIDAAVVAGVKDLANMYLREYNQNTPNASMYFINL